jgi:hypothetical protein
MKREILNQLALLRKDVLDRLDTGYGGSDEDLKIINRLFFERVKNIEVALTHTSAPVPDTSITELSAINAALLKLYPDDFALHLNAKQLMQVQKKHDAQVAKAERERENQRVLDSMKQFVDSGYYTGFAASQTERILWKIESLRAQQEPQQEGRR